MEAKAKSVCGVGLGWFVLQVAAREFCLLTVGLGYARPCGRCELRLLPRRQRGFDEVREAIWPLWPQPTRRPDFGWMEL